MQDTQHEREYDVNPGDFLGLDIKQPMTPDQYTDWTASLDRYPKDNGLMAYHALGLAGEAGEVADKIKKIYRDLPPNSVYDPTPILRELGDALFYLTRLADDLGATLQDVMDLNVEKLEDRKSRGVLGGSGDKR